MPGDEADHRFAELPLDIFGRFLFRRPADLADHEDGLGLGIGLEQAQGIHEGEVSHQDYALACAALGDDTGGMDLGPGVFVNGQQRVQRGHADRGLCQAARP